MRLDSFYIEQANLTTDRVRTRIAIVARMETTSAVKAFLLLDTLMEECNEENVGFGPVGNAFSALRV